MVSKTHDDKMQTDLLLPPFPCEDTGFCKRGMRTEGYVSHLSFVALYASVALNKTEYRTKLKELKCLKGFGCVQRRNSQEVKKDQPCFQIDSNLHSTATSTTFRRTMLPLGCSFPFFQRKTDFQHIPLIHQVNTLSSTSVNPSTCLSTLKQD